MSVIRFNGANTLAEAFALLKNKFNTKVDKIDGMGLSEYDLNSTLKSRYDAAYTHAQSAHAPTNAERNALVGVQKNGEDIAIDTATRKANVTVPTKVSELENDSGYVKGIGDVLLSVYPVGAIYISTIETSPATLFGGTWQRINDTFLLAAGSAYSAGSTGGAANVTLTSAQMPSHTHSGSTVSSGSHTHTATTGSAGSHYHSASSGTSGSHTHAGYGAVYHGTGSTWNPGAESYAEITEWRTISAGNFTQYAGDHSHSVSVSSAGSHTHSLTTASSGSHTHTVSIGSTGSGESHNNMPPYLTVYMWKRTA